MASHASAGAARKRADRKVEIAHSKYECIEGLGSLRRARKPHAASIPSVGQLQRQGGPSGADDLLTDPDEGYQVQSNENMKTIEDIKKARNTSPDK